MPTNIFFNNKKSLDSFAMKLAQKAGRTISVASPLLDGSLPDGSRVQVTYGTDIARKGSNFAIRKFFKTPLTPVDLMNYGTLDSMMLGYLWLAIEEQKSILIAGSTATGKTSLLNALGLFMYPTLKIVSIEDRINENRNMLNLIAVLHNENFASLRNATGTKDLIFLKPNWKIDRMPSHLDLTDEQKQVLRERYLSTP